jgi:CubicO group peptidase (beta-lactamase class C family)
LTDTRAGTDYQTLVRTRITDPLGMTITQSPELKARLAAGYGQMLQPVANWDLPTLAGAGALRDAQITFEVDAQGRAAALVLHQNGRDQRAARID